MKKKVKYIECIQLDDKGGDGPMLWRLDEDGNGDHFFQFLTDNYEGDLYGEITIVRLTPAQWKKAEKLGRELA